MTQQEFEHSLRLVLTEYFNPLFQVIGGAIAVLVLFFAVYIVISPFVRRV